MTAVEFLEKEIFKQYHFLLQKLNCEPLEKAIEQAKEMENNSYICSKCKSQINGKEIVQQMQDSEKSD